MWNIIFYFKLAAGDDKMVSFDVETDAVTLIDLIVRCMEDIHATNYVKVRMTYVTKSHIC